ncbi:UbiA prenyltransferase family protein [Glycomyces xiaoerkulensis]|uniref:UbiA prenyltransferase family protein n=1 Tax=Glycomyces xiaoerkulensis TaxID=2038139 RepID=UPI000C25F6B5|nr:UbiA prenyltransferase family protein [Glycomyces xiaoerkulensis]
MTSIKTEAPSPVATALDRPSRPKRAGAALALLRPVQWVKNLAVGLPLVDPRLWALSSGDELALAVAAFAAASAMVYAVNDIADRERDRHHPVKRHRPVASGAVSVPRAWILAAVCAAASLAAVAAAPILAAPVAAYAAINFAYSRKLREIPVLELFSVASGFPLRAVAGYLALGAAPSGLVVLSVLFASLLLVLGKRRRELVVAGTSHRSALSGYTPTLIDQYVSITAGLATATFLLFALHGPGSPGDAGPLPLLGVPLLVAGLFRYLQLLTVRGGDGDPTRILLRDPVLVAVAVSCVALIAAYTAIDPALWTEGR